MLVLAENGARPWDARDTCMAVYMLVSIIPMGYVVSYSSIARLLRIHPRRVAACLRANDNPLIIPCHRVVMADGRLGGYSRGGPRVKKRLLELEGVCFRGERVCREKMLDIAVLLGNP